MRAGDNKLSNTPRKYKWRYGPLRLAMPWIALVVGAGMIIQGINGNPLFVTLGIIAIAFGVIAFFVYRWMARKGI